MPKKTFFNLPEEKRETLIKIALEEFSSQDYNSASISRIVRQAGIAQGSLYQYFADKKDLYLYLLDLLSKTKLSFLRDSYPPQTQMDFFEYLSWVFETSLLFDVTYPAFSRLSYRVFYGGIPFEDPASDRFKQGSAEFMRQMVVKGIERGDINADIDPNLVVFVVEILSNAVSNYIPKKLGVTTEELANSGISNLDLDPAKKTFSDLIKILKFGLANKS